MKPTVPRSIEAPGGPRGADIVRDATGAIGHVGRRRRLGASGRGARIEARAPGAARGGIGRQEGMA